MEEYFQYDGTDTVGYVVLFTFTCPFMLTRTTYTSH